MTVQRNGRAAAAAAATAIVASATLAGGPAQATPAQAGAVVVDDVLTISGSNAADQITLDFTALDSVVVDLGGSNGTRRFASGSFHAAVVDLRSGDDQFRTISGGVLVDVPTTVAAGNGNDIATTGAGRDVLVGGNGADFVNGGVGTDTEVLGSGDDTAAWNPGEGNDAISGGLGRDTLAFNGSDAEEQMSLTADGTSAVFLRSPGAIRMDLDGVERLDLATFGGADGVTIGDLSGTALAVADIDLASAAGTGDNEIDTVVVNGTDRPDRVDVARYAGAVDVAGLRAETVVAGGEPDDRLEIDTFQGDDSVTVDEAARALLDIAVDLGVDQS
jgi:Ca2+-binding RTX toxin-like protein